MNELSNMAPNPKLHIAGVTSSVSLNLFGEPNIDKMKLEDWFVVPPFSILNSASKEWQLKKKKWMIRINDKAQVRKNTLSRCGHEEGIKNWQFMAIKGDTTSILDPVMCEILLSWFTNEGFNTLDPFAGDAVFGFCSAYKNRPFTGIELRKEQVDFNQDLIDLHGLNGKYICDTSENIDLHIENNSKDFIFSCPPYADLEIYSELENDLSNMSYDNFFITIENILKKTVNKLKSNRFACIVIGEVRHKNTGVYLGIVPKIIKIMCDAGLHYYNEIILQTPIGNLHMRAGAYMSNARKIGKQHQNILVFYKGNPKNINKHFEKLK
jgi:16S rRNA G966 N2-methylase RsmD